MQTLVDCLNEARSNAAEQVRTLADPDVVATLTELDVALVAAHPDWKYIEVANKRYRDCYGEEKVLSLPDVRVGLFYSTPAVAAVKAIRGVLGRHTFSVRSAVDATHTQQTLLWRRIGPPWIDVCLTLPTRLVKPTDPCQIRTKEVKVYSLECPITAKGA